MSEIGDPFSRTIQASPAAVQVDILKTTSAACKEKIYSNLDYSRWTYDARRVKVEDGNNCNLESRRQLEEREKTSLQRAPFWKL